MKVLDTDKQLMTNAEALELLRARGADTPAGRPAAAVEKNAYAFLVASSGGAQVWGAQWEQGGAGRWEGEKAAVKNASAVPGPGAVWGENRLTCVRTHCPPPICDARSDVTPAVP